MLSDRLQNAINEQINKELYSAYLYYAMAAYCDSIGLAGFSNWMKVQAQEEISHAAKMFNFVGERDGRVELEAIDKPPVQWKSALDLFTVTCAHEAKVTAMINNIVNIAREERDHATDNMLQWFVAEQVEEEATAKSIRDKLKLVGDGPGGGLYLMDQELGARVLTYPPPAVAGGA